MKKIILLFIFAIHCWFLPIAIAGDENPFTESLRTNKHLAEAGGSEGQYQLGKHFDYGWGTWIP